MLEWLTVLALLIFGLALFILEVIFIPGTTVVGIVGFLSSILGVYLSYSYFGTTIGLITMSAAVLFNVGALYYSFKSGLWQKLALKKTISSKVNEDQPQLNLGQKGVTLSALRPMGMAEFMGETREVQTTGKFLDQNTAVEIIKIEGKKIVVQPI